MKQLIVLVMFSSAMASAVCYDLSRDGQSWNEADQLCIDNPNADTSVFILSLIDPSGQKTVETFSSKLLMRAKCLCNEDVFGSIPASAQFPDLEFGLGMQYATPEIPDTDFGIKVDVQFHETTERSFFEENNVREAGTVNIRDRNFHYRAQL